MDAARRKQLLIVDWGGWGEHRTPGDADLKALLDGMAVVICVGRSLKGSAAPGSHRRQHPPSVLLLPVGSKWRAAGDGSSMAAIVADLGKMEYRNRYSGSVSASVIKVTYLEKTKSYHLSTYLFH
ncbi:hypothetical protein ACLOJK_040872 [Asimina triloba]